MEFERDDNLLALLHCWADLSLPARIGVPQTAKLLGFAEHDVPILVSERLLKPLGNPAQNAPKYFSAVEILRLVTDRTWLDKATQRLSQHWLRKRERVNNPEGVLPPVAKRRRLQLNES
jgi:hypothetical protein